MRNDRRTIGWWLEALERYRSESSAAYEEWEHIADHHQRDEVAHSIWSKWTGEYVTERLDCADAELIVQAVNMLPRLIAAVRAATTLADQQVLNPAEAQRLCRDIADALAGRRS